METRPPTPPIGPALASVPPRRRRLRRGCPPPPLAVAGATVVGAASGASVDTSAAARSFDAAPIRLVRENAPTSAWPPPPTRPCTGWSRCSTPRAAVADVVVVRRRVERPAARRLPGQPYISPCSPRWHGWAGAGPASPASAADRGDHGNGTSTAYGYDVDSSTSSVVLRLNPVLCSVQRPSGWLLAPSGPVAACAVRRAYIATGAPVEAFSTRCLGARRLTGTRRYGSGCTAADAVPVWLVTGRRRRASRRYDRLAADRGVHPGG
jgi:hypothetical protein